MRKFNSRLNFLDLFAYMLVKKAMIDKVTTNSYPTSDFIYVTTYINIKVCETVKIDAALSHSWCH